MLDAEAPVARPADFYGRKNIVRRIYSRIAAERPQSVAVIGGRKVGKTSLLAYLAAPEVMRENLPEPGRYRFVSMPGVDDPALRADDFLGALNGLLGGTRMPGETEYNRLQRQVEELHHGGVNLVCFFDDFHYVTRNTNFPLEFFSFLRSLANNYNLAYVTSSYLELQKLCVAKDIEESPFFNIFTNIALGPLSGDEARDLLVSVTGWDAAEAERLAAWAGPLPYVLKLVARACPDGPPADGNNEKHLIPVLKEYFGAILAILPRDAFKPLKDLVRGKAADPRDSHFLKPLVRHHFLLDNGEVLTCFSEAFKLFIQKHATAAMLKGDGGSF
ncbi:MAG: ATP-binding protein [Spirochaetales bacterium]|nr:ATP-binding protein [Spirochaetales bacterium]